MCEEKSRKNTCPKFNTISDIFDIIFYMFLIEVSRAHIIIILEFVYWKVGYLSLHCNVCF